ncbi:MAG TPA: hypothetical protein VMV94_20350 [Phycisphaerae bacterium]|nr:hypothetical protein [Phycisphaerae bacterium]
MKSALSRWMLSATLLLLPLVALMGCDEGDYHEGGEFGVDAILAIIYAVGDVALSIIEATT